MSWSPASCVKLMKRGSSSDRPVWVVPVFSGVTACFDSLLNSFTGYKRTLYGLNDPYLTGNDEALTLPFEEWIGLYIAAMKTKQPSGPYTILAYSQGMHWAWAIDEVLRKQGDVGCDAIVVLDPNFPAWSSMDRVAAWDGPQMAKAMGAPFCMMYPMIKLMMGMMQSQAKWDTAAARDKTTSGSIAQMGAGVDLYEDMMVQMEMDTGIVIDSTPAATVAAIPPAERMTKVSAMVAANFEGLSAAFVQRSLEFRACSAMRWPRYTPKPLPKSVKVVIVMADREHFKLARPYCQTQGFDRFVEGGMEQIDEVVIGGIPIEPPADQPTAKFVGLSKAWEYHFRFMHTPAVYPEIKKAALDKIGIF